MKLRNYIELLGLRARPQRFGYELTTAELPSGSIRYAQWLHPREKAKSFSESDVQAYRRFVAEGDFCIDIGAHTGDTTIPMAIAAGTTGLTLALEPNANVYHVLEKNARTNRGLCNIETMLAAAAPESGFTQFEYSDSGFCNGGRHEDIPALRHGHAYKLSVYCVDLERELREDYAAWLPRLKFIKTDAEGYDLQVLQSLRGVLKEYRPVIKAEVFKHVSLDYRMSLLRLLQDLGYRVSRVDSQPVGDGVELNEHNLEEQRHYDLLAVPE